MSLLQAKVKSVLSGDTVILTNAKGQERTLSLAYISAPRLRREGDEPFAFQSREYLRELLLGKVVNFEILYEIPTTKRQYGKIILFNKAILPDDILEAGWAKVRDDAGRKEESETTLVYIDKLKAIEEEARVNGRGVWGKGGQVDSSSDVSDPHALVRQNQGKTIDAIVERVLTGDRLIVRLMPSPNRHIQTMIVIAGVRTPATRRTTPEGKDVPAEPHGTEAHQFVEARLHQRRVKVQLLGVTPQNQLIGVITHPMGNIARFLLEAGLARSNDQHVTLLGNEMAQLRQAEASAKNTRRGIFEGSSTSVASSQQEADYTVARVLNAETIFLRSRSGDERRVTLSSIRQPKPSDPKQVLFGADAKEFLRKKLIGKHVKVVIDGKKPASEGYEEREVATITLNGKNIALSLVEAGYASVIRHRRDDDDRSPDYDALLLAEEAAQKDEQGMWSSKAPSAKQYQDYSENLQKAKMEASVLQRQKKVPAIVDYVRSGSRFVVLVPKDNAKLTFVLSGVRVPKAPRATGEAGEPYGQEAAEFANRRCLQRDVEIDVEDTDKVGGFIGTMHVGRENFARALVEEGLAKVHQYSAERTGHANELNAAEKKAKEGRKGLWKDWNPAQEVDEEEEDTAHTNGATNGHIQARRKDYRDVVVTFITEDGKLMLQQIGSGTSALQEMMSSFKAFHLNKANAKPLDGPPKVGDIVAGQFTADGEWYRARVRRVDREAKQVDLLYIDYGNSETLPWSSLRQLSQPQFSTQKLRGQATPATLSFLQMPTAPQYLSEAVALLAELTEGRNLVANVDQTDADGTLHITLLDPQAPSLEESINAEVVREGLARVPRKLKAFERSAPETIASLKRIQQETSEARRGMFEYGDIGDDDD